MQEVYDDYCDTIDQIKKLIKQIEITIDDPNTKRQGLLILSPAKTKIKNGLDCILNSGLDVLEDYYG